MRACWPDPWDEPLIEERVTIEVDVEDHPETPRLLGPDGDPLPRLVHRFGFRSALEWETP